MKTEKDLSYIDVSVDKTFSSYCSGDEIVDRYIDAINSGVLTRDNISYMCLNDVENQFKINKEILPIEVYSNKNKEGDLRKVLIVDLNFNTETNETHFKLEFKYRSDFCIQSSHFYKLYSDFKVDLSQSFYLVVTASSKDDSGVITNDFSTLHSSKMQKIFKAVELPQGNLNK